MEATEKRPVFRVMRRRDLWMVKRPQATIVHGFQDLYRALAFVREEARSNDDRPSSIDLWIDDLCLVAQFDACRPSPAPVALG
jgi:hypothetical protein